MTALAITPNYEKKRLKLAGTVAAGEHVAVTIVGGGAWIGTGKALRLRVICGARTVAKFPFWTEDNAEDWPEDVTSADAWDSANEGADATCVLNLNTVPAAKLLRFGGMCLWVLDDAENHTLYGSGEYIVEPWPKERGEDEPYNLDEYPDIVAELKDAWEAYQTTVNALLVSMDNTISLHAANTDIHVTAAKQTAWTAKYDKPVDGIPKAHLASAVQASLGLADSAIQEHQDISGKADKATTLAGYGITDAKISNGVITLGENSITPLTAHQDITGKADLVDGKVPASQLPSYVDDVLEYDVKDNPVSGQTAFPAEGEAGKIYVATSTGKVYRWSGSQYIEIANPDLTGYKPKQAAVSDPTASGTAVSFIDTISQNANGVIAPTKKTVATVVASSSGVGGSAGLMTATDKEKLNGVAAGAEVNVIETVKVNGTALTPSDKAVDITVPTVPTNVSAFTNDAGYLTAHQSWNDVKPVGGITASDLASAVQTSLGKADTALQAQDITGKADMVANATYGHFAALTSTGNLVDSGKKAADFAAASHTHSASDITSGLATVATTGSYNDLSGKPTNVSAFTNDAGYLVASSAAPAFSSDSTVQYAVGSHCTYNGKLYKCTTATTGGTWVAASWEADVMDDPDAVLDITAQNQLRVVAKDGTLLWAQGYDLASTSSATLACDAVNNFTFTDGATSQAFALPTAPTGKVGDFGLDIDNSANTGAATMTLTGLDSTFSVVVPEGESLNDMLAIAAGELARFYITLSTFRVNNLPTWHIVKQVVENGGAMA